MRRSLARACGAALMLTVATGASHGASTAAGPASPAIARVAPRLDAPLQRALEAIARAAPGVCGVSVMRLGDGRFAGVRAGETFPTMSTYKLPIALAVLRAVDRGALSLADSIALHPWDMNPGWSDLTDHHPRGGVAVSIHDLLDLMVTGSDNTACDVLIKRMGGGAAITREVAAVGVRGMRVDEGELEMGNAWYGLRGVNPDTTWDIARWRAAREAVPAAVRAAADRDFARDPRNATTPRAMTDLLAALWSGRALRPASADTLLAMMGRCATGAGRLRAGLPPQVKLVHKTGSSGTWGDHTPVIGDVGIATLPGGGGAVAIAVYVRDVRGPVERGEATMADVARAVFEAWNAPD